MLILLNSVDNSEYMRNGDYTPTRFEAQIDSVNLIFQAKTQSNPESTVGLMTMAGNSPEVKSTLTNDFGKILAGVHETKVSGTAHLSTAIQVAALALKHRLNKVQRQRVIVFVGSPVEEDSKVLVKLAKKMKKNNVAVDFINFGEQDNANILHSFIEGVNSSDNSHLVEVPPGPHLLSDVIASSAIINEDGGSSSFAAGGGAADAGASGDMFEFGVDPSVDPELALALRMSLEDEKARQEREKKQKEDKDKDKDVAETAAEGSKDATHDEDQEMS